MKFDVAAHRGLVGDLELRRDQSPALAIARVRRHVAGPEEVEDRRRAQRALAEPVGGRTVSPICPVAVRRLALKARAHCARRTIGSRSLPKLAAPAAPAARLGVEQDRASSTAFRSPRTPLPLFVERRATRARRRPALGLLVTRRWISCLPMNGADVRMVEQRVERESSALPAPSRAGRDRRAEEGLGRRFRAAAAMLRHRPARAVGGTGVRSCRRVSRSQPVKTRARPVMSSCV